MLSNLMVGIGKYDMKVVGDHILRHMILNSIRYNLVKFRNTYGKLVIASDGGKYWRKDVFPHYKWHRNDARNKDSVDWPTVFASMDKIRDEIKDNFPYPVINIPGVEADDIIAVFVEEQAKINGSTLILSSDKDFIQLHHYKGVKQFDPIRKKFVEHPSPKKYLVEHIIKGDRGDGIPNIKSSDDCFVTGQHQNRIQTKYLDRWTEMIGWGETPETVFDGELLRNWYRNQHLIDLSFIPPNIKQSILQEFEKENEKLPKDLTRYFMKNNLRSLLGGIGEF